jgi:hypothetical protein
VVPRRYRVVPRRYRVVPRRYRVVPRRYRVVPRRYRVVPRRPMLVQGNAVTPAAPASVIAEVADGLSTRLNRTKARRGKAHQRDKASDR